MKRIAFISILLSTLCFGCNDPLQSLEGTRWKLVGIVNESGSLRELEPKDCKECYTLVFDTDSTFLTLSTSNEFIGGYIADYETYSFQLTKFAGTKVYEVGDGELYSDIFLYTQSFYSSEKELRLYYNDNKNYLLFKSQES